MEGERNRLKRMIGEQKGGGEKKTEPFITMA
jgi:hypothetical protein